MRLRAKSVLAPQDFEARMRLRAESAPASQDLPLWPANLVLILLAAPGPPTNRKPSQPPDLSQHTNDGKTRRHALAHGRASSAQYWYTVTGRGRLTISYTVHEKALKEDFRPCMNPPRISFTPASPFACKTCGAGKIRSWIEILGTLTSRSTTCDKKTSTICTYNLLVMRF